MFGRVAKIDNNYYISPHNERFLQKQAVTASIIAGAALALLFPALILWIAPGIGSLLWLRDAFEAMVVYTLLFICAAIGLTACFVLSFFGYKIRKKVMRKSAPTLGFGRSSYNGIFFTAALVSLLLIYQIVCLTGYRVAAGTGYIDLIIAKYELVKTADFDVAGVIVAVFYALSAAASWTYYVFTYRVNRTMQFVSPDKTEAGDAPAVPTEEEAAKHRPENRGDSEPPRSAYGLTEEEKEKGRQEFEDDGK